ncbi:hypothetical protein L484_005562 [Morus notabilis]|uniref:Uncharacterized protein n=1 Tax=Morus notabilis TaxID=981085 RepID=W9QVY8_9ROSA|nr:hypothetical protein L484_005562 [Morus notabilis]
MAEAEADYSPLDFGPSAIKSKRESPEFLEVKCNSSGKTRRFAPGTDAGFAVSVINRKLMLLGTKSKSKSKSLSLSSFPLALHIEASKENENEEPISFGPNSPLFNYGDGWILQTVVNGSETSAPAEVTKPAISLVYIGKIILAFILLFLIGAIFTLALENLPLFISFVTSSA